MREYILRINIKEKTKSNCVVCKGDVRQWNILHN